MVRHIFLPQPLDLSEPVNRLQIETVLRFICGRSLYLPSKNFVACIAAVVDCSHCRLEGCIVPSTTNYTACMLTLFADVLPSF